MGNFFDCSPKKLPPVIQNLVSKTERSMVRMKYVEGKNLSLTNSKIGGLGYIPATANHPTAKDGAMLVMLLQLNFSEIAEVIDDTDLVALLPSQGLLQVFIDVRNYGFGMSNSYSDRPFPSDSYQVRFWEDVSLPVNVEALDAYLSIIEVIGGEHMSRHQKYMTPMDMRKPLGIDFTQETQSVHPSCIEYERLDDDLKLPPIEQLIEETAATINAIDAWWFYHDELQMEYPENVLCTYGYDEISNRGGSQVLGYPDFAQGDTRIYNKEISDHILLFQLDSDMEKSVMWGDCGTAHFFIRPKDLAIADFSRLAYYWDCT